jgi:hypothetical protein
MGDQLPKDDRLDEAGRIYREVFDLLIFLSTEIEMGRLPQRSDGVGALRMAAGLVEKRDGVVPPLRQRQPLPGQCFGSPRPPFSAIVIGGRVSVGRADRRHGSG